MYRLSARQILVIALISGLFAAGTIAVVDRVSKPVAAGSRCVFPKSRPAA